MHYHYRDIRSRIAEPPKWWDEHGTPRYCDFGPGETSDIYCKECCLLRIRCQDCGAKFDVCMSWNLLDKAMHDAASLSERIENGSIHYGDPPNDRCCAAGPTMNSEPIAVLQFWRSENCEWSRVAELERVL